METELTKNIKLALWEFTNKQGVFGCNEVTIGWFGHERVDYMTYDTKGVFRCYEIKITASDFHSKNHNSFVGHLNYYAMPKKLYEKVKNEIPDGIGVILFDGSFVMVEKRPKRREPAVDIQVLKDSMIRSLCRDVDRFTKAQDPDIIRRYQREVSRLNSELKNSHERNRELSHENYELRHPERRHEEDA